MILEIGIIMNTIAAILLVKGHPYISHWCFLVGDPLLALYAFLNGEYQLTGLYIFYTILAIKGIVYYHNKTIYLDFMKV